MDESGRAQLSGTSLRGPTTLPLLQSLLLFHYRDPCPFAGIQEESKVLGSWYGNVRAHFFSTVKYKKRSVRKEWQISKARYVKRTWLVASWFSELRGLARGHQSCPLLWWSGHWPSVMSKLLSTAATSPRGLYTSANTINNKAGLVNSTSYLSMCAFNLELA